MLLLLFQNVFFRDIPLVDSSATSTAVVDPIPCLVSVEAEGYPIIISVSALLGDPTPLQPSSVECWWGLLSLIWRSDSGATLAGEAVRRSVRSEPWLYAGSEVARVSWLAPCGSADGEEAVSWAEVIWAVVAGPENESLGLLRISFASALSLSAGLFFRASFSSTFDQ